MLKKAIIFGLAVMLVMPGNTLAAIIPNDTVETGLQNKHALDDSMRSNINSPATPLVSEIIEKDPTSSNELYETTSEAEVTSNKTKSQVVKVSNSVATKANETVKAVSLLGHFKSSKARIYKDYKNTKSYKTSSSYTNAVYYIKKQAQYNGVTYYLIGTNSSTVRGIVGWVKASDLTVQKHVYINRTKKTVYLSGTGRGTTKPWGGKKDNVYSNLQSFAGKPLAVNMTERVGSVTWYRGIIAGKTIWISEAQTVAIKEQPVSRLGHIKSSGVRIYKQYTNPSVYQTSASYINSVYYIKKQAEYRGVLYYLIGTSSSTEKGIIGWVKATDLTSQKHTLLNRERKTVYVKGVGRGTSKPWGGKKDNIFSSLESLAGQPLAVNMTEQVGSVKWLRGVVAGKTIWVTESQVTEGVETPVSKLAQLKNTGVRVYKQYSNPSLYQTSEGYVNTVYYVKTQSVFKGITYLQLSTKPSATEGVIGWVKATDLTAQNHTLIDTKSKLLYISGKGSSYKKVWGGSKDVISSLLAQAGQFFEVTRTEKVGNILWYWGSVNNQQMWIAANNLNPTVITNTTHPITYTEALNRQMAANPQTDLYRNAKNYMEKKDVDIKEVATITQNGVNLRTSPVTTSPVVAKVNARTQVIIKRIVEGELYQGSTKWYEIEYNNKLAYVHTNLANPSGRLAFSKSTALIYERTNNTSHVYGKLAKGASVKILTESGNWLEVVYGPWKTAKRADVDQYMNPTNTDRFQHLVLSANAGVDVLQLNKVLLGKGTLENQGQAFLDASKQYSVNEIYLISHALLETAQGKSQLASGVEVGKNTAGNPEMVTTENRSKLKDIKKVYNMYGTRAYDSCPVKCGSEYAYSQGWFTPKQAIIGGASFIGKDYIHNAYNQNTIYKMRWNHQVTYKQYATDIGWAAKQIRNIKELYSQLDNPTYRFDFPKFK